MKTVLLVDDEPWLTEALSASLEARGFECLKATNMTDCVKLLKRHVVSVLVTDIMMPPGDSFLGVESSESGFHLIEFVQVHWPRMPIVCLSVVADQAKIRFLKTRGVRYLRKGETPLSTALEVVVSAAEGRVLRLNSQ